MMLWFRRLYFADDTQRSEVKASPLLADNLQGLPPTLLITAAYDQLRDEGELYAERLKEAGVSVIHKRFDNVHHGFFGVNGRTRAYEEACELLVTWMQKREADYQQESDNNDSADASMVTMILPGG
jgi:acetyl esterase